MATKKKPACKWMLHAKDYADCGKPATHYIGGTTPLTYCHDHASVMMKYFAMNPINPGKETA